MAVAEKIEQYVRQLPERLQVEVLDFVEYLLTKENATREEREWTQLSLALAMRDREENDEEPDYSVSDLKESFS